MTLTFPTHYSAILEKLNQVDAIKYGHTRNYLSGAVTQLSPYLSRGVIDLPMVRDNILAKTDYPQAQKLIQELAWREYFQRVWQHKGDALFQDLKQEQLGVLHKQLPTALLDGNTGITVIDQAIQSLYNTGYMHNHARMYTAMLACNLGKAHWLLPAQWMYHHLLDGDLASNMLSWQWVVGTFSSKKYYANQENINRYSHSVQPHSFLDTDYETLSRMAQPKELQPVTHLLLETRLPLTPEPIVEAGKPLFIYNSYNIDPLWHQGETGTRILLLEPSHFNNFPVSERVLNFILQLAKDLIPGIQIFTGEFSALKTLALASATYYKEHPMSLHYTGIEESRDWMFPLVTNYFPGFFGYWKKCEKYLQ